MDLKKYPKFIHYQHAVFLLGPLKEKTVWYDLTTVVWFPILVKHTISKIEEKKCIAFDIPFPFGGYNHETITIVKKNEKTEIRGRLEFDLGNKFVDRVFGDLLERRFQIMLEQSIKNIEKYVQKIKN